MVVVSHCLFLHNLPTSNRNRITEGTIMIIILMGVCGSGKTTVGQTLAKKLGWSFADADDFHSEENKNKMSSGQPLTDQDRIPWLMNIHHHIKHEIEVAHSAVVTCSALKKSYRQILLHGTPATAGPSVSSGVSGNSETNQIDMLSYKKENDTQSITNKDNFIDGSSEQNRNREISMCMKTSQCVNTNLSTHNVVFILLQASLSVLEKRMSNRQGHFMPSSLLSSQIKTLEIPIEVENSLTVDVDKPVEDIINEITDTLGLDIYITDNGNT